MASRRDEISAIRLQKLRAYDAFLCVTDQLQNALKSEEMKTVDHLIERREELIKYIKAVDHQLHGNKDEAQIVGCTSIVDDLYDKLKKIMAVDKDCQAIAVRRRDLARKDLMDIHRNRAGLKSYGPKNEALPKFIEIQT